MNKLSKKFVAGIVMILVLSCVCLVLFNSVFLEKYYLYQKRNELSSICNGLAEQIRRGAAADEAISHTEESSKAVIVKINNFTQKKNDTVNDEIRTAFQHNGIGFQKYWLWEGDHSRILDGETMIRLYTQEKLNYGLLVEYMQIDSSLYIATIIIPNIADAFGIINSFFIGASIICIVISILFIILLVKRITKPLSEFEAFASRMEDNRYLPLEIHTGDELENVADSLNTMGNRIMNYQDSLHEKNDQMEQLLDNVAHDLKTPVSLVQLYANGMKDGLDDGTFLNTILEENERMSNMISRLLYMAQMDKREHERDRINVSEQLTQLVNRYALLARENDMEIHSFIEKDLVIAGDEELTASLFLNLITNAVKYSAGRDITLKLSKEDQQLVFTTINKVENETLNLSEIWTPYYVGEESRNKELSGTGLGLSIVKKICETQGYTAECFLQEENIVFMIYMKN